MNRAFSLRERVLLLVLAIIIVAGIYYLLIHMPISAALESIYSQQLTAELELEILEVREVQLIAMREELAEIEISGSTSYVPVYDNLPAIMNFLNSVLKGRTYNHTLNFTGTVEKDGIVRRGVQIHFSTQNYASACRIIEKLQNSEFVNRIGDISMVPLGDRNYGSYYYNTDADYSILRNPLELTLTMTFYERLPEPAK